MLSIADFPPSETLADVTPRLCDDDAIVSLKGVCKSFTRGGSTVRVLDDVSLDARRGECVFLVGPSGSGKSTLLSIIGCVLSADRGELQLAGHDVSQLCEEEVARLRLRHVGFVFQRFHLIRGLTAEENVAVPLILDGWSQSDASERAQDLLEAVELGDKRQAQVNRLSVGQCQRVAFARALAADPDLILADEPTASLDARTGHQALALLRRLTVESGKTVMVVTHDPRILTFADRILLLENGTLQQQPARDHLSLAGGR